MLLTWDDLRLMSAVWALEPVLETLLAWEDLRLLSPAWDSVPALDTLLTCDDLLLFSDLWLLDIDPLPSSLFFGLATEALRLLFVEPWFSTTLDTS